MVEKFLHVWGNINSFLGGIPSVGMVEIKATAQKQFYLNPSGGEFDHQIILYKSLFRSLSMTYDVGSQILKSEGKNGTCSKIG